MEINDLNDDNYSNGDNETEIGHLPCVVFEYILSYLSPYRDLLYCKLVSKSWQSSVISTIIKLKRDFMTSLTTMNIVWSHYNPSGGPSISPRYSHSACCVGDSVFIFGGCTIANTTFNDLWRFDLTNRCWIRPIATGAFPPPKACASFVNYNDSLILFGGWSHSSPYPIHHEWRIFNHIHFFDTKSNRWSLIETHSHSPSIAGHSAGIVNDEMVVFGGLMSDTNSPTPFISSNDVWVLNLKSWTWRKQMTNGDRPHPRYGHSQLIIDNRHILIIGGCGGPNMLFSDIWLLSIPESESSPWEWEMIEVKDNSLSPQISFHPACKIDNIIVVLGNIQKSRTVQCKDGNILRKPSLRNQYVRNNSTEESNSNVQKMIPQIPSSSVSSSVQSPPLEAKQSQLTGNSNSLCPSLKPNSRKNRQRQLEGLDRMEQRIRQLKGQTFSPQTIKSATIRTDHMNSPTNPMQMFVLDISKLLKYRTVSWIPQMNQVNQGPEEIILYSLVAGRAEIIMFGGIQKDKNMRQIQPQNANNIIPDIVSNELHIISAKRIII